MCCVFSDSGSTNVIRVGCPGVSVTGEEVSPSNSQFARMLDTPNSWVARICVATDFTLHNIYNILCHFMINSLNTKFVNNFKSLRNLWPFNAILLNVSPFKYIVRYKINSLLIFVRKKNFLYVCFIRNLDEICNLIVINFDINLKSNSETDCYRQIC